MPKIFVQKSMVIQATPEKIYTHLSNFKHWAAWSPWLIAEPEAKVTLLANGKSYHWQGDVVGEGKMTITKEDAPNRIEIKINFLKPFKSEATTHFELVPETDATLVTWTMNSSLPFFLFWMKKSMQYGIGMDYQRGLKMLKNIIEEGTLHSKLSFPGIVKQAALEYVGITTTCPLDQMPQHMSKDFEKLLTTVYSKYKALVSADPFSIYHQWEPLKNRVTYTAAIPLKEQPKDLKEHFKFGNLPAMKVHKIHHKGPYRFVDNAWATQMMYQRAKKFNALTKVPPMEFYLNSPKNTPELELESEICFPVK